MSKIRLDKYYTSPEIAKYIVEKTKEILGEDNITEYIEPSAGAGVFLDYLDKPYIAYDIEPEDNRIIKQDFLTVNLEYKKGRCIIGNPPFGDRNTLSVKFYKRSLYLGDYIAFILPISQLNNNQQMYEFDLIHVKI
jgi:predicted RNA methylase